MLWVRGDAQTAEPAGDCGGGHAASHRPYGSGMAEMLARDLAVRRLLIVSGMARGIDTCAHKGALAARMPTVAVWGTGIDVVYPKENKKLAEEILATGGAIVSELPMGTFPAPQNFPRRNRILSGLERGRAGGGGGENSGTRVTARCAAEQNRDLFAVPGNVTNKGSWTPNTLIKQGAKLVATWEDVWEDLPSQVRLELEAEAPAESKSETTASLLPDPVLRPAGGHGAGGSARRREPADRRDSRNAGDATDLFRGVYGAFRTGDGGPSAAACRGRTTCGRCEKTGSRAWGTGNSDVLGARIFSTTK